jgi:Vitamin B6 photo-protection and homoeostasis
MFVLIQSHFARRNNLADVSAKESSQETAVTLAGLLSGLFIATFLEITQWQSWMAFVSLTLLHVVANWQAVTCLTFNTLNGNRAAVAIDAYIADMGVKDLGELYSKQDLRPENIARVEPLLPAAWWHRGTAVFFPSNSWFSFLRAFPIPAAEVPVALEVSCDLSIFVPGSLDFTREFSQFGCDAATLFRCAESSDALSRAFSRYDAEEYVAIAGVVRVGLGFTKRGAPLSNTYQHRLSLFFTLYCGGVVVVAVAFSSTVTPEVKLKAYFQVRPGC